MKKDSPLAAFIVFGLWLAGTLFWWGFAFFPTSGPAPEWLAAARGACFGTLESGLPDLSGWMLLILGPLSFLAVMLAGWREELKAGFSRIVAGPLGKSILILVLVAFFVEATWVYEKVTAGAQVLRLDFSSQNISDLPEDYPRGDKLAPEFTLIDQKGSEISLSQFRGQVVMLTFAFAHCGTVCPLIVAQSIEAFKEISNVRTSLLIVTLDPWRDTPGSLPSLAQRWNLPEGAHILSGKVDVVSKVIDQYEIPRARSERNGDITHPAITYVIDGEGHIAYTFLNASPLWLIQASYRLRHQDLAKEVH